MDDLPLLDDWIYSACFDASGKQVIAGTWTGRVHVYARNTAQPVWQFDTNPVAPKQSAGDASVPPRTNGATSGTARTVESTAFVISGN